jgi:hypothetical protein
MADRLKQIHEESVALEKIISKLIETSTDKYETYEDFEIALAPFQAKLRALDREFRMILPCEVRRELNKNDHVLTINEFIEQVKQGYFIDYDGYGCYVKDNKVTNIEILPSDIKYNAIRKEFNTIVWFNK